MDVLTVKNMYDMLGRLVQQGFGDKQLTFNDIEYVKIEDKDVTLYTGKKSKRTCIDIDLQEG